MNPVDDFGEPNLKKGSNFTKDSLKNLFAQFPPTPQQQETVAGLRQLALKFAGTILVNTQPSAEQTIAIRRVWEALNYAELAVMLNADVF